MPSRSTNRLLVAIVIGVVSVGVLVTLVLLLTDREQDEAEEPSDTEPDGTSAPPDGGPVLVAKIDNAPAARPQTGLEEADVVYVEPVEGGQTRIAAVYASDLPQTVGPVRSARETDIDLLTQYGQPTLAVSGAAEEVLPLLRDSRLNFVTHDDEPEAYTREPERAAPHNLYLRPDELPEGSGVGPGEALDFGDAPSGGDPTTDHTVHYPAEKYELHWSEDDERWMVSVDGRPLESTDFGELGAENVVVQEVDLEEGHEVGDVQGSESPLAMTVGSGQVTVLRDGTEYSGTWSRSSEDDGTEFTTDNGEPIRLDEGTVWILLVPA